MRWGVVAVLVLAVSGLAEARPNIVVFYSDDHGWNDVGYHGSIIQTPNIDSIATEGVALDRY